MGLRITQQQTLDSAIRQAQARLSQIGELQNQLSSGLRISKPSDSPTEWGTLAAQKATVRRMETNLENITTVRQRLNQSVSSLTEVGNVLVRARELALSGAQSFERDVLAAEVDLLIDSVLAIANSADAGLHLYSGTGSDQTAFEVTDDASGRPASVRYTGSRDTSPVVVGPEATAGMLANGALIFEQRSRGETVFFSETGAAAGVGTDSGMGVGQLTVRNTGTSYASAVVSPGASSSGGDTVIGPPGANKLTIEIHPELGQVVRLNGGGPSVISPTATDLEVRGPGGASVFVDVSAVPPGLATEIDISASGTMSTDGGLTEVPIDFTASQVVTDSTTGQVTVVDSTNIRRAGTDRIEYSGTAGVFDALIQLRDDLRSDEAWSSEEFTQIMDSRISDITRAHDQILEFVGEQSVELANLETLESRTRDLRLVTQEVVTETENADIADVIVRLQTEQNHLQFIYATTANIMSTSLLDFL